MEGNERVRKTARELLDATKLGLSKVNAVFASPPKVDGATLMEEWNQLKFKSGGIHEVKAYEIGNYLDKWGELLSFTRFKESQLEVELHAYDTILSTVKKQIISKSSGTRDHKDADVANDSTYLDALKNHSQAHAKFTAVAGYRQAYEIIFNTISRELTRRSLDVSDMRRSTRGKD